jgi:hypothetical protein
MADAGSVGCFSRSEQPEKQPTGRSPEGCVESGSAAQAEKKRSKPPAQENSNGVLADRNVKDHCFGGRHILFPGPSIFKLQCSSPDLIRSKCPGFDTARTGQRAIYLVGRCPDIAKDWVFALRQKPAITRRPITFEVEQDFLADLKSNWMIGVRARDRLGR